MSTTTVTKEGVEIHVRFLNQLMAKIDKDRTKLIDSYGIGNTPEFTEANNAMQFLQNENARLGERIRSLKINEMVLQRQIFNLQDQLKEK